VGSLHQVSTLALDFKVRKVEKVNGLINEDMKSANDKPLTDPSLYGP
jgi:hypothetical protein